MYSFEDISDETQRILIVFLRNCKLRYRRVSTTDDVVENDNDVIFMTKND